MAEEGVAKHAIPSGGEVVVLHRSRLGRGQERIFPLRSGTVAGRRLQVGAHAIAPHPRCALQRPQVPDVGDAIAVQVQALRGAVPVRIDVGGDFRDPVAVAVEDVTGVEVAGVHVQGDAVGGRRAVGTRGVRHRCGVELVPGVDQRGQPRLVGVIAGRLRGSIAIPIDQAPAAVFHKPVHFHKQVLAIGIGSHSGQIDVHNPVAVHIHPADFPGVQQPIPVGVAIRRTG